MFNGLHRLNRWIDSIESGETDEEILISMKNGLRLFLPANREPSGQYTVNRESREFRYGCLRKLNKLRQIDIDRYSAALSIVKTVFVDRTYERDRRLRSGDLIVDCGANVGVFCLYAARVVGPRGRVIAIEPEPNNLHILERNIRLNNLTWCHIVPVGLWDRRGTADLFSGPDSGSHTMIEKNTSSVRVPVDTLPNILDNLGIGAVKFIKMDIEGAEIRAIAGMTDFLEHHRPPLAIESFHRVNGQPTHQILGPVFWKIGYTVHIVDGYLYARTETVTGDGERDGSH